MYHAKQAEWYGGIIWLTEGHGFKPSEIDIQSGKYCEKQDPLKAIYHLEKAIHLITYQIDDLNRFSSILSSDRDLEDGLVAYFNNLLILYKHQYMVSHALKLCKKAEKIFSRYSDHFSNQISSLAVYSGTSDHIDHSSPSSPSSLFDSNAYLSCCSAVTSTCCSKLFDLGKTFAFQNLFEEALEAFTLVISALPPSSSPYFARSLVYGQLRMKGKALDDLRKAHLLDPLNVELTGTYFHSLKVLAAWNELTDALNVEMRRIDPDHTDVLSFTDALPLISKLHLHPFACIMFNCSQQLIFESSVAISRQYQLSVAEQINSGNFIPFRHFSWDPPDQRNHTFFSDQMVSHSGPILPLPEFEQSLLFENQPHTNASLPYSIRIGFVSPNFINHAQGTQLRSFFQSGHHFDVEIFLYSLRRPWNSESREAQQILKNSVPTGHFVDVSNIPDDLQVAEMIYANHIDVLIDLCGLVDETRINIFAYRPSPVQISFLGYPSTTGADYIDYYLGDAISTPLELQEYFTEKLILLPHTYQITEHLQEYPEIEGIDGDGDGKLDDSKNGFILDTSFSHKPDPMSLGLPTSLLGTDLDLRNKFVFCNFNQAVKIDPPLFRTWMEILVEVPNSVLLLLAQPPESEPYIHSFAQEVHGVNKSRIIFVSNIPKNLHIRRMLLADLFLDTLCYTAHTSACDALWAALPIITIPGQSMASRVSTSILLSSNIDTSLLIVSSLEEYKENAIFFATHPQELRELRQSIYFQRKGSPLFDTPRQFRNVITAITAAWTNLALYREPVQQFNISAHGKVQFPPRL